MPRFELDAISRSPLLTKGPSSEPTIALGYQVSRSQADDHLEALSMLMPHRSFNSWSLRLIMILGAITLLTLKYVKNIPDPEVVSTHNESAEVVDVGMPPDASQTRVGRYGVSAAPVGGTSSSGRVRLDDGSEYFVLFNSGKPEPGSLVNVVVRTFDDGRKRVNIKRGY